MSCGKGIGARSRCSSSSDTKLGRKNGSGMGALTQTDRIQHAAGAGGSSLSPHNLSIARSLKRTLPRFTTFANSVNDRLV